MIVPEPFQTRLAAAGDTVELCAADGTLLGVFTPVTEKKKYKLESEIPYEEAMRRVSASDGKGRKLKDIKRDLEARG